MYGLQRDRAGEVSGDLVSAFAQRRVGLELGRPPLRLIRLDCPLPPYLLGAQVTPADFTLDSVARGSGKGGYLGGGQHMIMVNGCALESKSVELSCA